MRVDASRISIDQLLRLARDSVRFIRSREEKEEIAALIEQKLDLVDSCDLLAAKDLYVHSECPFCRKWLWPWHAQEETAIGKNAHQACADAFLRPSAVGREVL